MGHDLGSCGDDPLAEEVPDLPSRTCKSAICWHRPYERSSNVVPKLNVPGQHMHIMCIRFGLEFAPTAHGDHFALSQADVDYGWSATCAPHSCVNMLHRVARRVNRESQRRPPVSVQSDLLGPRCDGRSDEGETDVMLQRIAVEALNSPNAQTTRLRHGTCITIPAPRHPIALKPHSDKATCH